MRSDAAREAPPADLVEQYDALRDLAADRGELVVMDEIPELTPERADAALAYAKRSSPELASLAAKYVNLNDAEMAVLSFGGSRREDGVPDYVVTDWEAFANDVRRLAASVLSQA